MMKRNINEWVIALTVIACSIFLFLALAFALSGTSLGKPSRVLRVNFYDITGIALGSQVKYAGAIAGKVSNIRMLDAQERANSGDPFNAIEVTLALNDGVPSLPQDITASVAADTLLSDKFILLSGGSSNSQSLAADTVLQGITPTTFDKLTRDIDAAIAGLRRIMSGTHGEAGDIFDRIRLLLTETQSLLTQAKPVLEDATIAQRRCSTVGCGQQSANFASYQPARRGRRARWKSSRPAATSLCSIMKKKSIRRSPTSRLAPRT